MMICMQIMTMVLWVTCEGIRYGQQTSLLTCARVTSEDCYQEILVLSSFTTLLPYDGLYKISAVSHLLGSFPVVSLNVILRVT